MNHRFSNVGVRICFELRLPRRSWTRAGVSNFKFLTGSKFIPVLLISISLLWSNSAWAYSILTHEQIIDILWKDEIVPVLVKRFPNASDQELKKAHAYAYGGCLVQDMGYYPFGNRFFSDLTHYVRGGDFVANLIETSTNLFEYAYALGALAHYCADNAGHPFVNRAVALSFPELRRKYGGEVTYEENPRAHIRVEFGFDMTQVAKNRYTSDQYHSFIGFEVSKPVLERAFMKTYGIPLGDVLKPVDLSIGTFRRAASQFIPALTKVALEVNPPKVKDRHDSEHQLFRYRLSRSEYERDWGKDYRRPTFLAKVLAFVLKWIPKVGPLKALAFKIPTQQTEALYVKSVNRSVELYRDKLREIGSGKIDLPNLDFDTGRKSQASEYMLGDEAYMKLMGKLAKERLEKIPSDLKTNVITYFSKEPKLKGCKERRQWRKARSELRELENEDGR